MRPRSLCPPCGVLLMVTVALVAADVCAGSEQVELLVVELEGPLRIAPVEGAAVLSIEPGMIADACGALENASGVGEVRQCDGYIVAQLAAPGVFDGVARTLSAVSAAPEDGDEEEEEAAPDPNPSAEGTAPSREARLLKLKEQESYDGVREMLARVRMGLVGENSEDLRWWCESGLLVLYGDPKIVDAAAKVVEEEGLVFEERPTSVTDKARLWLRPDREADYDAMVDILKPLVAAKTGEDAPEVVTEDVTDGGVSRVRVTISGHPTAVAEMAKLLVERGLAYDSVNTCCRTVRLYHVRQPATVGTLLTAVGAELCPDVKIAPCSSVGALPSLLLTGPEHQLDDMERVIATIDRPHPQVRLDLWVYQVSGKEAVRVADAAYWARQYAEGARRLLREYLGILRDLALEARGEDALPTPMSTTEALMALIMSGERGTGVRADFEESLETLYDTLVGSRRSNEEYDETDWASIVLLDVASDQYVDAGDGNVYAVTSALVPVELIRLLEDEHFRSSAREALDTLQRSMEINEVDPRQLPPGKLQQDAERARVAIQRAQQALANDIERIFMEPLQECLSSTHRDSKGRLLKQWTFGGVTSLSVLSGMQATLTGAAVSSFDMSQPARLDADTLKQASGIAESLGAALPAASGGSSGIYARKVVLGDKETPPGKDELTAWATHVKGVVDGLEAMVLPSESALLLSGTEAAVNAGVTLLQTGSGAKSTELTQVAQAAAGTVSPASALTGSVAGLPADRLLSLALALGQEEQMWSALRHGVKLTVRPDVLPGGDTAELEIKCTVSHEDEGTPGEGGRVAEPISRVAKHEANTSVYVDSLDLFALSSLEMETTHPRPDFAVPVLGQMPLIGQMFTYPRSPRRMHHQSILLVQTHVLVTDLDLTRGLGHPSQEGATTAAD